MIVMRLDPTKIDYELERIKQNKTWLANKIDFTPQRLNGLIRDGRPIFHAEKLGNVFGVDPRHFIILVELEKEEGEK